MDTPKQRMRKCDRVGCDYQETEEYFGKGFPGWAPIVFLVKDNKNPVLCPKCIEKIKEFILGRKELE